MRSLTDIFQTLPTHPENGLSSEGVAVSRQRFGQNRLTPLPRDPLWRKFLEKFDEPIIKILLAAALLSMFVDMFETRGAEVVASIALAVVVAALAGAWLARLGQWVPALMFASACVLFFVGLAAMRSPPIEGLAVMM